MKFKEWFLEGEYGTSAYGPIDATFGGSANFSSPNTDQYTDKGIVSKYQAVDKKKRKPTGGRANDGSPTGAGVVSAYDLPPLRGVSTAAL